MGTISAHGLSVTVRVRGAFVGIEPNSRRMRRRKRGRREMRRRDPGRTIALCKPCHRNVHTALSNGDLGLSYASLEELAAHPDITRFTEWVRERPHGRGG